MEILFYIILALLVLALLLFVALFFMRDPSAALGMLAFAGSLFVLCYNIRAWNLGITPDYKLDWWLSILFFLGAIPGFVRFGKIIKSYFIYQNGMKRRVPYDVIRRRIMQVLDQGE